MRAFVPAMLMVMALTPESGPAQGWQAERQMLQDLRDNGVERDAERVTIYFKAGELSDQQMDEFTKLVDHGVTDIETFLKLKRREGKIRYYISDDVGISHTFGASVLLPMERVKRHSAPYLHETTHILAPCRSCPLWFQEGLASYVQSYVSEHMQGYDGVVFARNGNRGIDQDARRWLADPRGQAVLPFVGAEEEPPGLDDRNNVAAPYYVMAQSLIKFLVTAEGTDCLMAPMHSNDFDGAVTDATGKTPTEWRTAWVASLSNGG